MLVEIPETIIRNLDHFTGRAWLPPLLLKWYEQTDDRICVLTGEPGSGKSIIVSWLAGGGPAPADAAAATQLERIRSRVKAAHFCIAASGSIAPKAFAKHVAEQLTQTVAGFGEALTATLGDLLKITAEPHIGTMTGGNVTLISIGQLDLGVLSDESSFDCVLREPLKQLYANGYNESMVLLVDALDEAVTYTGEITIVKLLSKLADLPRQVRLLVTTRSDPRVLKYFRQATTFDLIKDTPGDVDDVHLYLIKQLAVLADEEQRMALSDRISQAAQGNFLYAHLVVSDLLPSLPAIFDLTTLHLPEGLDDLYHDFLNRELGDDEDRWYSTFKPLLGLVAVAQGEGLSRSQIAHISGQDIEQALRVCKQYLRGDLPDGPFRPFHRSFADFLEDEKNSDYHIDAVSMHHQIVEYYLKNYAGRWSQCDAYGLHYLSLHMVEAEMYEDLYTFIAAGRQQSEWAKAHYSVDGSYAGYLHDLDQLWRYAESSEGWNIGRQIRYALIESSIRSFTENFQPELLVQLVESGLWKPSVALAYISEMPLEAQRAQMLEQIAPLLTDDVNAEALAIVRQMSSERVRSMALRALAQYLPSELIVEAFTMAQDITNDEWGRAWVLTGLVASLPEELKAKALTMTRDINDEVSQVDVLEKMVVCLPASLKADTLALIGEVHDEGQRVRVLEKLAEYLPDAEVLALTQKIGDEGQRVRVLEKLAEHLPDDLKADLLMAMQDDIADGKSTAEVLTKLIEHVPEESKVKVLTLVLRIRDKRLRVQTLSNLIPYFSSALKDDALHEALKAVRKIDDESSRAEVLGNLMERIPVESQAEILTVVRGLTDESNRSFALYGIAEHLSEESRMDALEIARAINDQLEKFHALTILVPYLPDALKVEVVHEAMEAASKGFEDKRAYILNLIPVLEYLPEELRANSVHETLVMMHEIKDKKLFIDTFRQMIGKLPEPVSLVVFREVLVVVQAIKDEGELEHVLSDLIDHEFTAEAMQKALETVRHMRNPYWLVQAYVKLVKHLPEGLKVTIMREALMRVREMDDKSSWMDSVRRNALDWVTTEPEMLRVEVISNKALAVARAIDNKKERIHALNNLAMYLPHPLKTELMREVVLLAQRIDDKDECLQAMCSLARYLPDTLRAQALAYVREIAYEYTRYGALEVLIPHLPDILKAEALIAAREINDEWIRASVLSKLAFYLPDELKANALEVAQGITDESLYNVALIGLVAFLSDAMKAKVLQVSLSIEDDEERSAALCKLIDHLPRKLKARAMQEALDAANLIMNWKEQVVALSNLVGHLSDELKAEAVNKALETIPMIRDEEERVEALNGLISQLPAPLKANALSIVQGIDDEFARSWALITLIEYLPNELKAEALALARGIGNEELRARVLSKLMRYLPRELEADALALAHDIGDKELRTYTIHTLSANLATTKNEALTEIVLTRWSGGSKKQREMFFRIISCWQEVPCLGNERDIWPKLLRDITLFGRLGLILDLVSLAPLLIHLGGSTIMSDLFLSMLDVLQWWP